ncbi:hypothetical protein B9G55_01740 [Saccharibacillus sp. O16]|nr:hypothetical protein B9G55_01740 [Saccharibacillus sp. O16]
MRTDGGIHMKILIVDDEPRHRRGMVNLILSLRPGDSLTSAGDGEAALRSIEEEKPDLVLTDIRMPNMDGLEFLKRMESQYPRPRVVMVSAYNLFDYAQEALRYGASDYLLKPVDADKLTVMLSRIEQELTAEERRRHEEERSRQPRAGFSENSAEGPVQDCLDWIEAHLHEELTLERAAERLFFNPSYFSTWIKQQTGQTFTVHLTQARMRRARVLLEAGRRIGETAEACGYPDTKYFCRVFKKMHGMSPAVYKHGLKSRRNAE